MILGELNRFMKRRARNIASDAYRKGIINRQNCAYCKSQRTEIHHQDHLEPVEVLWLCKRCHETKTADEKVINSFCGQDVTSAVDRAMRMLKSKHFRNRRRVEEATELLMELRSKAFRVAPSTWVGKLINNDPFPEDLYQPILNASVTEETSIHIIKISTKSKTKAGTIGGIIFKESFKLSDLRQCSCGITATRQRVHPTDPDRKIYLCERCFKSISIEKRGSYAAMKSKKKEVLP